MPGCAGATPAFSASHTNSATERADQLLAMTNRLITLINAEIEALKQEAWGVHKLLNGYIRFLRSRSGEGSSRVQEPPAAYDFSEDELNDLFSGHFNPSSLQPFNE